MIITFLLPMCVWRTMLLSLHPQDIPPVPEETRRVAQAAFPRGNVYIRMRDELGAIYDDQLFASLFPACGQPAAPPWRLALTTVMQFAEGLSDRQAADAVRSRIDWKYALSLELTDPGFDHTVLSEFRTRLVAGQAELLLLDTFLAQLRERGLLKGRGRQRTDSTHILAAIRVLNRLELIGETLRHTLNSLASAAPDWLRARAPAEWFERYGRRLENYRLPQTAPAREALAATIGADGRQLLQAVEAATDPPWLRDLPAVRTLRQGWAAQSTDPPGPRRWRAVQERWPAAVLIASPSDVEARYCTKHGITWVGDKVHLTEPCENDQPHLITGVMTTPATTPDGVMGSRMQDDWATRDLLPGIHLLDGGSVDADLLVTAQSTHQIDVVGPPFGSYSHQRRAGEGSDLGAFRIDWEAHQARCPQGHTSIRWTPGRDVSGDPVVRIRFHAPTCRACPVRSACTQAKNAPRQLTVRPQAHHEAVQAARQRQETAEFTAQYAQRAGVEGTQAQAIRRCGLRQGRYVGHAKTHLQHVLTATALNLVRVAAWLEDTPRATTRRSAFAALAA
jgi:transposase